MIKRPAFLMYAGDWLKDPQLRRCCPATRGIWIDWICAMHETQESGVLEGTVEQLARIASCTVDEAESALYDLSGTRTAEINNLESISEDGHAIVTVINRRMQREAQDRAFARERKQRQRTGGYVESTLVPDLSPPVSHECPIPSSSSFSYSRTETRHKGKSSNPHDPGVTGLNGSDPANPGEFAGMEGSDDALAFADWFRASLPPRMSPSEASRAQWAQLYRDLIRLDHRTPEEIRQVCQWARNDHFWTTNFYSPLKLRKRNSQGVLYYDLFVDKMRTPSAKQAIKPNYDQGWAK